MWNQIESRLFALGAIKTVVNDQGFQPKYPFVHRSAANWMERSSGENGVGKYWA